MSVAACLEEGLGKLDCGILGLLGHAVNLAMAREGRGMSRWIHESFLMAVSGTTHVGRV